MNFILIIGGSILIIVLVFIIESVIVVFSPVLKEKIPPFDSKLRDEEEKLQIVFDNKENVSFNVKNERIDAFLYLPDHSEKPLPCIIMNTGLGGTKNMFLERYASEFNKSGFAVITYDYRHFGKSDGSPRQLYSMSKQLEDCKAAINFARNHNQIDPGKIIIWGTSGGGGYGLILAASDPKIACISCQCATLDHKADSQLAIKRDGILPYLSLVFHGQRDKGRQRFSLGAHHLPIVGTGDSPAIIKAPGAYEGYSRIASDDAENKLCARIMLTPHKNPIDFAHLVTCPVLIQICENDNVANPQGAVNTVNRLKSVVEVKKYNIGHFDVYFGENFIKSVHDQIDFFKKYV